MFVRFRDNLALPQSNYTRNEIAELPDAVAVKYIRAGLAEFSPTPPEYFRQVTDRLDEGAGRRCIFLPFVGEFGHMILSHIRQVYFHRASWKIVCCKWQDQCLYPDADEFCFDWTDPIPDAEKVGTIRETMPDWTDITRRYPNAIPIQAGHLTPTQEMIYIRPGERIPFQVPEVADAVDVVLSPRNRKFCPDKNYDWQPIADAILAAGYSFGVVGTKDDWLKGSSFTSNGSTAVAIDLLRRCRLFIGSDSGGSHLACEIGTPSIIIQCPGYRDFVPRMKACNDRLTFLTDGWQHPEQVIDAALKFLTNAH
jgi:hypothetical protein